MKGFSNHIHQLIELALTEDGVAQDITSLAVFGTKGGVARGAIRAKQPLVVSGLTVAEVVFKRVSSTIRMMKRVSDGDLVPIGGIIATVRGDIYHLLRAERVVLNFLQHLSGIATLTHAYVERIKPYRARLLDTRKTLPGLRFLEKQAVRHGGADNHRFNLSDQFLIKDNHIQACGGVGEAITRARRWSGRRKRLIEVETRNLTEVKQALAAGADIILLDNMGLAQIRCAVEIVAGRALVEVSGGVKLGKIRKIAATGVARISVGAITHSAPAVDISFDILRRVQTRSM